MAGRASLRTRWIDGVLAHHRLVLVVAFAVTVVAALLASRLQVDSDLRRLLPPDHDVVVALEHIEETFGSTGSVNVVIRDGTPAQRHAFTDAIAADLEGHPLLEYVDYRLPSDFFVSHALYYLSDAEMEELEERIQAWLHHETCQRNPDMCVSASDPKAKDALERFIEGKREASLERTGFRDRYEREGIAATVVLLHPIEPAASLEFSRAVSEQMRTRLQAVYERPGTAWAGSDMSYNVVGPYTTKADEHRTIRRDTVRALAAALFGVMAVLYLLFRSGRALLVLLVPLACGVVWSLAATYLLLGTLNLMTSMISTVVMGTGIDGGIHFYVRAKDERRRHDNDAAIRHAFAGLIGPLLVASSTTVVAFLAMSASEFPGFSEFGLISAVGVALCLVAMVTVLPALAHLVGIKRTERPPLRSAGRLSRLVLARPATLLAVIGVLTAATALGARRVSFEYNGRALQSDSARENSEPDTKLISAIFGKDIHAGILVRDDLESTRRTLDEARRRHAEFVARGESVVSELFAAPDLLPPAELDQEARRSRIEALLEPETIERLRARAEGRAVPQPSDDDDWDAQAWDEEPAGDEASDHKPAGDEASNAEPAGDEASKDEPSDAEPAGDEASKDEPSDAEPAGDEASKDEPSNAESAGDEASKDEPSEAEPAGDEASKDEPSNAESAGDEPADDTRPADPEAPSNREPGAAPSDDPPDVDPASAADDAESTELSRDDAGVLVRMLDAKPFGIDDLPPVLLNKVRTPDGAYGIFAYPAFDAADMRKGVDFTRETSSYIDDPNGLFVGETTVYAAMFSMLRGEAPVVLSAAAVLIAGLVYWQVRSVRSAIMTMLPLALALWWLVGLMGAMDLRFTLFNLPILPAILGIGVDNGVYLTDSIRRSEGVDGLVASLRATGGAIMAATATTAIGFAAFMAADSAGVRGIGSVAALGITLAAIAATLVLPALSGVARLQRSRRDAASVDGAHSDE